jgi:hypothetical protein
MFFTDIGAFIGDAPEGDACISAEDNAETANDAEGDGELAGDGKIADRGHASNPFSSGSRRLSAESRIA